MAIPMHNLVIYQGDDFEQTFRYVADGVAVDLTGYSIFLECNNPDLNRFAVLADQAVSPGSYSFTFVPADTINNTSRRVAYEVIFYPTGLEGFKHTKHGGSIVIDARVPQNA